MANQVQVSVWPELLKALSPVLESLVWAAIIVFLLFRLEPAISALFLAIRERVAGGAGLSLGPEGIKLTEKVEKIESLVEKQKAVVDKHESAVKEQGRRIDQITASTENTLQSLASLVIADPMKSSAYNLSVEERINSEKTIIVGCQDYTEQRLLCAIIKKLLECELRQGGLDFEKVITKYDFGGAGLNFIALSRADIDIYPAYTWQGFEMAYATSLAQKAKSLIKLDAKASIVELNEVYEELSSPLKWVCHTGFQDNWVIVMKREVAKEYGIKKISELRGNGDSLRFGCEHDFFARPNGYSLLKNPSPAGYGLSFKDVTLFEHSEAYDLLESDAVHVIDGFTTDPHLQGSDKGRYRVLKDDQGYFGNYFGSVVIREELTGTFAGLEKTLKKLEGRIDEKTMSRMIQTADEISHVNHKYKHLEEVERIAEEFIENLDIDTGNPSEISRI